MTLKESNLIEKIKFRLSRFFSFFNLNETLPLRLFKEGENFIFIFLNKKKNKVYRLLTKSDDGFSFVSEKLIEEDDENFLFQYPNAWILGEERKKKKIMFFGDRKIQVAIWENNNRW